MRYVNIGIQIYTYFFLKKKRKKEKKKKKRKKKRRGYYKIHHYGFHSYWKMTRDLALYVLIEKESVMEFVEKDLYLVNIFLFFLFSTFSFLGSRCV